MSEPKEIYVVTREQGKVWNVGGAIICKVSSAASHGRYTVLELILAPQAGPPLHVHRREDEIFFVLTGQCTVGAEEQVWQVEAGDTVLFPRGVPHFFRNESAQECRVLITAVPGGLDHYFDELHAAIAGGQADTIPQINQKYEITFFAP